MDRAAAIGELPEAYATAIRLADDGLEHDAIAQRLGVAVESVGPLLRVASAKLARVLATERMSKSCGRETVPDEEVVP
jgi:DNA-directed RNA polymerase specialized sigma24 family protein